MLVVSARSKAWATRLNAQNPQIATRSLRCFACYKERKVAPLGVHLSGLVPWSKGKALREVRCSNIFPMSKHPTRLFSENVRVRFPTGT